MQHLQIQIRQKLEENQTYGSRECRNRLFLFSLKHLTENIKIL
jgi:hypothetical protein